MRSDLGPSGQAIWDAYDAGRLDAATKALVLEYARCADTADRLDGLVKAREERWALLVFDDMGEVHLTIDKILDQARNQQNALRGLHAELRQAGIKPVKAEENAGAQFKDEDMLARRRREREQRERQLR